MHHIEAFEGLPWEGESRLEEGKGDCGGTSWAGLYWHSRGQAVAAGIGMGLKSGVGGGRLEGWLCCGLRQRAAERER